MILTVFVIDDDKSVRDSLTFLLRAEGITSRSYESAADFLGQLHPDHGGCIITDIKMPEMDGIGLIQKLGAMGSRIPIIVITGHADVPLAVQAMKAGVTDFIEKPFEREDLLRAVRNCLELSHQTEAQETERQAVHRRLGTLTDRELQVLDAVVEGRSNKEIGQLLDISPRTVEIYRANVMSKMRADSLSHLVKMMLAQAA